MFLAPYTEEWERQQADSRRAARLRREAAAFAAVQEKESRERERIAALVSRANETVPIPLWRTIIRDVIEKHGLTLAEVLGDSRRAPIVRCRHEAMRRLHAETDLSFAQIGQKLGGRSHATVMLGIRAHVRRNRFAEPAHG